MTDVKNKISYDETVDEALLQRFFADSARMDIADDGFTDRVMRRLPEEVDARCYRLYRLWTAAMVAVCVAVFFFVNGFQLLKLRVCGAVGGFLGDVVHAVEDRVGSFSLSAYVSFPPSADWTTLLHTSLMIAIALVVLGSLVLYDLNESV
ncbi:MAG: DUF5056 domain-containing protein [Prevotella sp.]|nr:DUF5056 domain-containing protein [Prevotella sp.]MDY4805909.1 DUF5056 domain-containing protein [Prevotella sp.]MDY5470046.1 DUF5056 domain-containing protein [Prevotella sp.]